MIILKEITLNKQITYYMSVHEEKKGSNYKWNDIHIFSYTKKIVRTITSDEIARRCYQPII